MKKLIAYLLVTGSLGLSPHPAIAEVDQDTARKVMQEVGLWDNLATMSASLRGGMQADITASSLIPPNVAQSLMQAIDASFAVKRTQATALNVVRGGLDPTTIAEIRKWNASALGQKLLALDKASAASNTESTSRLAAGQAELTKADAARREALADIINVTTAVDGMTEIALETAMAMMHSRGAATPGAPHLPPDNQLRIQLQGQLAGARQQTQALLTSRLAVTYASLSTKQLQEYAKYLSSPSGANLTQLALSATVVALRDGNNEMRRRLSAPMKAPGRGL